MAESPVTRRRFQCVSNRVTKVKYTPRTLISTTGTFALILADNTCFELTVSFD
jgi:hypothetical protein